MRKLVIFTLGYSFALCLAHYLLPLELLYYFAGGAAVLFLFAFILPYGMRYRTMIFTLALAAGFSWTGFYRQLFIAPAERLVGHTLEVNARVVDYPTVTGDYSSVALRLDEDWTPHTKLIVYDYENSFSKLRPGDELCIELRFISAKLRNNAESDYYYSSGTYLRAYTAGDFSVSGTWEFSFLYAPKHLGRLLKDHITQLFPEDVAPLIKALLTGDKSDYYENDKLYSAMKSAGFSHVVAVSGMHVAFILGMLRIFTGRRRMTAAIGIPLIWIFAAMSGMPPSVVRASFMMTLMLLAPLLKRENDPPTSLSAALLLLTVLNPQSIGSVSLQLSFAAMAGIIIVTPSVYAYLSEIFDGAEGVIFALLRFICSSISSSLGALVFTTPLMALHFGFFPLYGIITNLLCLWAMSLSFMLSYFIVFIGLMFPSVGASLAWAAAWIPRLVIVIVEFIARLPFAVLSVRNNLVAWWLVFLYALIAFSLIYRRRKKFGPVIPICCSLISLMLLTVFIVPGKNTPAQLSVIDVGQGQCIVASSGSSCVVIDCGAKSGSVNAGDTAADYMLSKGLNRIDLLILTHLHADHANGAVRLMNRIPVANIALPDDCEDTEYRDSILSLCYTNGTEVYIISSDSRAGIGDFSFELFAPLGSEDINERGLIILGSCDGSDFLITGDAGEGTEKLLLEFYELDDIDLLVVGHHGSKNSSCEQFLDALNPEEAIISVGANNYGHPSEEVLERLFERDITVRRTDTDGTITIRLGNDYG